MYKEGILSLVFERYAVVSNRFGSGLANCRTVSFFHVKQVTIKSKTESYTYHRRWSSTEDRNRLGKLVRSRPDNFRVLKTVHDSRCSLVPD